MKTLVIGSTHLCVWKDHIKNVKFNSSKKQRVAFVFSLNEITNRPFRHSVFGVSFLANLVRSTKRSTILVILKLLKIRIIAIDLHDNYGLSKIDLLLAQFSDVYFKRELPKNKWNAITTSLGNQRHVGYIRRTKKYRKLAEKLRPIALGVAVQDTLAQLDFTKKKFDVFYCGDSRELTERVCAMEVMRSLEAIGLSVHYPQERLSKSEYLDSIRQSWIVLSPMGNGWDCFRHYETAANGAFPLMSYPTIQMQTEPPESCQDGSCFVDFTNVRATSQRVITLLSQKQDLVQKISDFHKLSLSSYTCCGIVELCV